MMHSGSHCGGNIHNTGVHYIQRNSESTKEEKNHLFNHIDRLAAGHDVTVSNTMIKVTYNKGIKDHSVTSVSGNEFDSKRHSVPYQSTFSENYNNKLSKGDNCNNSFNDIVFIPKHVQEKNSNGISLKENLNKLMKEEYSAIVKDGEQYNTALKHSSSKDKDERGDTNFNNHIKVPKEVKTLRVHLNSMNASMAQALANSPIPVNHIKEDQNEKNNACELSSKKFIENDSFKNVNENKSPGSSDVKIQLKKDKLNVKVYVDLDRDKLQIIKGKDENFKKKSPASEEGHNQAKKPKKNSNISGQMRKDKVSLAKIKEKKVNVSQKEKKVPEKALNDTQGDTKDGSRRELLREDPTLPAGWRRIVKGKYIGTEFKPVICIASPEGRKFYFKAKLKEYLERTNSSLNINDFHFGLYEKNSKEKFASSERTKMVNAEGKQIVSKKSKKRKQDDLLQEPESKKIHLDNNVKIKKLHVGTSNGDNETADLEKKILLVDPDLPPGWARKVRVKNGIDGPEKFQVCVISPDGKKFRRKYLLHKYLLKTRSPLHINQFYFGRYPRKDGTKVTSLQQPKSSGKHKNRGKVKNSSAPTKKSGEKVTRNELADNQLYDQNDSNDGSDLTGEGQFSQYLTKADVNADGEQPMLEDPNLPSGWRRYIKVRSSGKSAGRMEVIVVGPDGRKHRSKGSLEHYIKEKGLNMKIDDFDFTIFGKNSKRYSSSLPSSPVRQKSEGQVRKNDSLLTPSNTGFSNLNPSHSSIYDSENETREALMINYVGGIMINCGLRDLRSERRLRVPREEQEKILKKYLESENMEAENNENEISSNWIQQLIHCRSDFGTLEVDAATTIATLTKEFLQELTRHALEVSKSESCLEYSDLAELVDKSQCLSPLKTLIPKKITFKEFIRLNRPTRFSSFT